jgi:hypothetical protein
VEFLSTDLPVTYKGLMEKTYTWIEVKEVSTNGAPMENNKGTKPPSWEGPKNKHKSHNRFTPYNKDPNHGLLGNLTKSPREILATEKAAKAFEPPLRMVGKSKNRDTTNYCHFHEDFGHETNSCLELKKQIEEAVKSGQLTHLVKGIRKGKEKATDTQLGRDNTPQEAPILMVRWGSSRLKRKASERETYDAGEITFPSEAGGFPSKDPVIIKVVVSNVEVNKVYMDYGSSCEVIYKHYFRKLSPTIRSKRVESRMPLVGFSGERSWPLGEIPLEVTLGSGKLTRTEILKFVIVKSKSPYNMLIGRTAMQKMGIVVSTVHATVKFQTANGVGTIFSSYHEGKHQEAQKNKDEGNKKCTMDIREGSGSKEHVALDEPHSVRKVEMGKRLPTTFRERLEKLLEVYEYVFVGKYSDITGVPRLLTIGGRPFSTEHKLNESKHIKPVKQKPHQVIPDRSAAIKEEVDKLTAAGILRMVENPRWVTNPIAAE